MTTACPLSALCLLLSLSPTLLAAELPARKTTIDIRGQSFLINGKLTYEGRTWKGHKIEGLLLNSRMVQGIFEDQNLETRPKWNYPDGTAFDPERNTREFI